MFDGKWPASEEVVRLIRERTDTIQVSFSGGKDSVCCYLACRDVFPRVQLVHYYLVPDLEFVERGLRYYERLWGVEVVRVPGPWVYKMLNKGVFQTWDHWQVIHRFGLPANVDYELLRQAVAATIMGVDPDRCWIAVGTRAKDSVNRNMRFRRFGPVHEPTRKFFPAWDWDKARVVETIRAAGVKLPEEYHVFGRTFDALSHRFLKGIKDHWPDDYRRILDLFPMAEAEVLRYEFKLRREGRAHAG